MPRRNLEERREYMRQWRARNPDKVRANDARDRERQRIYRRAHLGAYAEYQRNRRDRHPRNTLVTQAKSRAKRSGVEFNVTEDNLLWPTHCPILGVQLDYNTTAPGARNRRDNSPSLDRRDNSKGYVVGNVFVISHRANRLKSDASVEELLALSRYAMGARNH